MRLAERAPAKINLTLVVKGRRPDGYHELESLVAFAGVGDRLTLDPAPFLSLTVEGPTAGTAGAVGDNLVLAAARALASRRPGLRVGAFRLAKRLPVAAGLGGGSSDAAAALRLLARLNDIARDDACVIAAARETGADVPVCLAARACVMAGIGERLSAPLALPRLACVLVNPGVPVATADVFGALGARPLAEADRGEASDSFGATPSRDAVIAAVAAGRNDLEAPAVRLAPAIATALAAVRATDGCLVARMSGSGSTVFALYADRHAASRARAALSAVQPTWWVRATALR